MLWPRLNARNQPRRPPAVQARAKAALEAERARADVEASLDALRDRVAADLRSVERRMSAMEMARHAADDVAQELAAACRAVSAEQARRRRSPRLASLALVARPRLARAWSMDSRAPLLRQAAAEATWAEALAAERLVAAAEAERLAARVEEKVRAILPAQQTPCPPGLRHRHRHWASGEHRVDACLASLPRVCVPHPMTRRP